MRRTLPILLFTLLYLIAGIGNADTGTESDFPGSRAAEGGFDRAAGLQTEDEFLPVEEAYVLNTEFEKRNDSRQLRLNWQIADGYYLYRKGFSFALSAGDETLAIQPAIPDGKEKQDEYFGLVQVYYHGVDITLPDIPAREALTLTVTSQGCADEGLCYPPRTQYFQLNGRQMTAREVDTPPAAARAPTTPGTPPPGPPASDSSASLPYMLLFAVLGGIILNLMPCVFPVLSLKVLGFANDKGHSPPLHGLSYSVGVIVSFVAVAALLVSLKAAGAAVGWGFHLQSPWFVAVLCYLFFAMGLSLSGFVDFGSQWMNIGGQLTARTGYGGSFFTGVLATVVASPCTAPFMGTALGFAVTQPTAVALLVFAALGVGMALPVLILSCSPRLLRHIPRPGPWMDTLKQVLAFPLYLTAIWLAWVVGNQTGVNGMAALLVGCLLIVLALWLWRGRTLRRSIGAIATAAALALLGSSWLQPTPTDTARAPAGQLWQAYSPERLRELRDRGEPVFVNITADWCITCLTNEKVTLSTAAVKQSLKQGGFTYLKGDWTNYDPRITELLSRYDRSGIPLYLVYPAGDAARARVLPQILTVKTVVAALDQAAEPDTIASHP